MSGPRTTQSSSRPVPTLPAHIAGWQLPPGWRWGARGLTGDRRHYQQVIDGLERSLSLVTAPDPEHAAWLMSEAQHLAHRDHPAIPTTYHYWMGERDTRRGPGYLRRWVTGESAHAHLARLGTAEIPYVLQVLRGAGSTLSYLHDSGTAHGALSADTIWVSPTGRLWLLEWQWAIPRDDMPPGITPSIRSGTNDARTSRSLIPPEWTATGWAPTPASDQWQLAAMCFAALTGEYPPPSDIPPVSWLRPECPASVATALDRALLPDPAERFSSIAGFLRVADRGYASRGTVVAPVPDPDAGNSHASDEARVRWALGDDYEVLSSLGSGSFGRVWRARDLSLEREVALKVLHPRVATDARAVAAFWREAKLAAQLAHPGIVPIYDWDGRGDLSWYTMELAEEGSVANLVARHGPQAIDEIAPQVELVLDGLSAAHAVGIVHRDLKPENLLIDRYRRWRITDFGIANVTGEDVAGTTGTPAFAAPEQLLGESQGASADLFALAGIVVFVVSGRAPFGEGEAEAIIARQLAGRVDLSNFPAPLVRWVKRGLAANPDDRFGDAADMKQSFREAMTMIRRREKIGWWRRP